MANLQNYSLIYVTANSKILVEETKVSIRRMSGAQVQKTVAKGLSGFSPGANMAEFTVASCIPQAGFEFDPGPFIQSLQVLELGFLVAGQQMTSKCVIVEDDMEHASDSPSGTSFKAIGTFPTLATVI